MKIAGLKKRYLFLVLLILGVVYFLCNIYVSSPSVADQSLLSKERTKVGTEHFTFEKSWLKKNKEGIYEMYIEGNAFERGVSIGKLSKELIAFQEKAFIEGIRDLVPSPIYLNFIKYIVAWKNRKLQKYIPQEFQQEIFGMSFNAADEYDYVGPKFQRKLYYHAAHDIGHTVQNMGLIGCTAFSVWGENSEDGTLLTARNFDFYIGEDFAKNKVLLFVNPDKGYSFASYSWPGFIGVVSGMNEQGLSVSLNAGPPALPSNSKMPVSILARQILQYASNLEEAVKIAQAHEIFVSESFVISSAKENQSIIIEKTPEEMSVVYSNEQKLLCTNHFQSKELKKLESNIKFQKESSTKHRHNRLSELFEEHGSISTMESVTILRDWENDTNYKAGIGNEISINQMIAHHSILFQPAEKKIWISIGLNPMDKFIHYDLDDIFATKNPEKKDSLNIQASNWIVSLEKEKFLKYKKLFLKLKNKNNLELDISKNEFDELIGLNPNHYEGYLFAANYFIEQDDCEMANFFLQKSEDKIIPWQSEKDELDKLRAACSSI